jgi:hypothetical protein
MAHDDPPIRANGIPPLGIAGTGPRVVNDADPGEAAEGGFTGVRKGSSSSLMRAACSLTVAWSSELSPLAACLANSSPCITCCACLSSATALSSAWTCAVRSRSRASPSAFAASAAGVAAACADSSFLTNSPTSCRNAASYSPPARTLPLEATNCRTACATGRSAAPVRPNLVL